jgi:hypothetical protein
MLRRAYGMGAFATILMFASLEPLFAQPPATDAMWGYAVVASNAKVPYQILERPSHHKDKNQSSDPVGSDKILIEKKPVQPYAYGWFGTQPSPKWSRSFGTRGNYTQWSLK